MDVGYQYPDYYFSVPEAERGERCSATADWCIVDQGYYFIRACLEIPVIDGPQSFIWGVWGSVSEKSFEAMINTEEGDGGARVQPYFSWFNSTLPGYLATNGLKAMLYTQPSGLRPLLVLEPTDHPLAVEQRNGITMKRVQEIIEPFLHNG